MRSALREGRERSLAFLAPDIIGAALDGRLPEGHGVSKLLACAHLSWDEQGDFAGVYL